MSSEHDVEWAYGAAVQRSALRRTITMAFIVTVCGVAAIGAVFWIAQSLS